MLLLTKDRIHPIIQLGYSHRHLRLCTLKLYMQHDAHRFYITQIQIEKARLGLRNRIRIKLYARLTLNKEAAIFHT